MSRHFFDFDPSYRWASLPFGITSRTAHVDLTPDEIHVRFGLWRPRTSYDNIVGGRRPKGSRGGRLRGLLTCRSPIEG